MTLSEFKKDDRFATLTSSDINCSGGNEELAMQRLLDPSSDAAFEAVLDTDGDVWTTKKDEDGEIIRDAIGLPEIEWESLDEFVG